MRATNEAAHGTTAPAILALPACLRLRDLNTLTLLMLPPLDSHAREWADRIMAEVPEWNVVLVEDEGDVERLLPTADAAYGWISPEQLPKAEKLGWLQNPFAGPFAGYYYDGLIKHPMTICNPRGIYSDHISHHILMFMLALSRGLPYWMDAQRERRWDTRARKRGYVNLVESTVLIHGVGGIGAATADLCAAFCMRVIGIDARSEHKSAAEIYTPDQLDAKLPEADFVVTTVPHTPETEGIWNAERFGLFKESAYFINIGRGMTTRLDDLVGVLESGRLAGAALDVYEIEPLPAEHALWGMENVILTPHVAVADATDLPDRRVAILVDNARRFRDGEPLSNVVDKSRWF